MGNNIALVVYSLAMSLLLRTLYGALGWDRLAQSGSVVADTAISTVIIIFCAEFLPKSVFRNNPNFYYRALAPVIYFFYILLYQCGYPHLDCLLNQASHLNQFII